MPNESEIATSSKSVTGLVLASILEMVVFSRSMPLTASRANRAEFVTIVNKLFSYTDISDIKFTDVNSNAWYYKEVQKAFNAGYISGVSETLFAPDSNLTREQAAIIVAKLMKLEGNASGMEKFADSSKVSEWAKSFAGAAAAAGIIKGYEDNTFRPKNQIKRAEALVILYNATGLNLAHTSDLTIDKAGTVIENGIFENVHITKAVGSGDVTLKNVTITGELIVEGGGQNSIIIEDSIINKLKANKADGKVRILLTGDTVVAYTVVLSGATLEQNKLTGQGFEQVVVDENVSTNQTIKVSRAEFAIMLVRVKDYYDVDLSDLETLPSTITVTDYSGHWGVSWINILINLGIFTPDEEGRIYPQDFITNDYLTQSTISLLNQRD